MDQTGLTGYLNCVPKTSMNSGWSVFNGKIYQRANSLVRRTTEQERARIKQTYDPEKFIIEFEYNIYTLLTVQSHFLELEYPVLILRNIDIQFPISGLIKTQLLDEYDQTVCKTMWTENDTVLWYTY